jgi:parvulin-like peptidyl-prolyl isomerase
MNIYVLLIALGLMGCNTQSPVRSDNSSPDTLSQASIEQISAFPKLKCDPNAQLRTEVRARHIAVIAFPKNTPAGAKATPEEIQNAYAKIQSAHSELNKGEPFESVWKKYSDPRTSGPSGDLGYFKKGVMIPELENVAFCIPAGEVSPIFRTIFGFHLVQVTDVRN